jgi:enoyl-CoA hydratase
MDWNTLRVSFQRDVALLELNVPARRNAMCAEMAEEFPRALEAVARPGVRALVVTGAGSAFSAGGSFAFIEENMGRSPGENEEVMLRYYRAFLGIREVGVPVVAALNGPAIGAGAGLALACDLRVAGPRLRMAFPFVKLGLPPGMGTTFLLPRLVGPGVARELLLTGRTVGAEEALELGLIHRLTAQERVLEEALALAREVAGNSPAAVRATRRLLQGLEETRLRAALAAEARAQARLFAHPDVAEGLRAVREGRAPRFGQQDEEVAP